MPTTVAAAVQYANEEQYKQLRLVAEYAGILDKVSLDKGSELSLKSSDGNLELTGLNTICRYIAELSKLRGQLLGADEASSAQVTL